MANLNEPKIIKGNIATDERGSVSFVNNFNFKGVKRFYIVENSSKDIIRGFHGHKDEEKYVFVLSGKALICAVEMDDPINPSKDKKVFQFVLSAKEPAILHIPGGYANGVRAMEENTKVIFFSIFSMEETKNDDYRFPYDYWGKEVWNI
ncbi:MAG: dTDP-4-dehydrorhamnose 3,5-epimerase family protein [Candidatus Parcubacteria bacterium]|nr:dTDP-4-dehydrorhamnose 3,5-epimerase family protein [Candidatus Parcubacteria bacterium]